MTQERPQTAQDVTWYCRRESGVMSEIVELRPLNPQEVDLFLQDRTKAAEICPGGVVISGDSKELGRSHLPEKSMMPDLNEIKIHQPKQDPPSAK